MKGPLFIPNKVTVHSATVNSKNVASAKVNIFYSDIPVPGKVHGALVQRDALHTCSPRRAASPRAGVLLQSLDFLDASALAGVPVLLVAHEGPVVAQDVHRVLPVPAGAAVVLEAGLVLEAETMLVKNNDQHY